MNKIKILILIIVFSVLITAHWFFGSLVFTKYLYGGFDRSVYAQHTLTIWLNSMVENKSGFLKTYWPNDTIRILSSDLPLKEMSYKEIHIIIRPFDHIPPFDSSWIGIELDKSSDKNPFSYTYDITGHCYMNWRTFSTGADTLESLLKINHWGAQFICRRYKWFPDHFIEMQPNRFLPRLKDTMHS